MIRYHQRQFKVALQKGDVRMRGCPPDNAARCVDEMTTNAPLITN
jgi:hypothetical protein